MAKGIKYWKRRLGTGVARMESYIDHLDLRRIPGLDDDGLGLILADVKGVNMLDLNETEITNKAIALLSRLEYINELRLKECNIENDCIPSLDRLTTLTFLHVRGTKITIDGLLRLTNLANLTTLMFSTAAETDPGFDDKMQQLRECLPLCEFVVDAVPYQFNDEEG
jgi:hypothetical protein